MQRRPVRRGGHSPGERTPAAYARATSSARLRTPQRFSISRRCPATVFVLMLSTTAASSFVNPAATWHNTSISRTVKWSALQQHGVVCSYKRASSTMAPVSPAPSPPMAADAAEAPADILPDLRGKNQSNLGCIRLYLPATLAVGCRLAFLCHFL